MMRVLGSYPHRRVNAPICTASLWGLRTRNTAHLTKSWQKDKKGSSGPA